MELFAIKTTSALETAQCLFQHFGRFGTPEVIHTDRGPAFHNDLIKDLCSMTGVEQSLIRRRRMLSLNALLFDKRARDKGLSTNSRWCDVS